jgi:hypothetical protein
MEFNGGNPYIGRRKHIKFIQRNMHKCLCIKEVKLAKKDIIVTGDLMIKEIDRIWNI